MNTRDAYNRWAETYDVVENKTRDLEAHALQKVLSNHRFEQTIELGCGTGKNTERLGGISKHLVAVDFSEEMLAKAKAKIGLPNVQFVQADITKPWTFEKDFADLLTCSLILEHIEDLDHVFHQAVSVLKSNGLFYVCELHPFKQYSGSKARFETGNGVLELECFVHHVSDYFNTAINAGFTCVDLHEWFDNNDRNGLPRLISFLFKKP